MSKVKDLLKSKALAFNVSIRAMRDGEKGAQPTATFGDDYNNLRGMVAKEFPHLVRFLPPTVITDHQYNQCYQRYSELDAFCEQIFQLLSTDE